MKKDFTYYACVNCINYCLDGKNFGIDGAPISVEEVAYNAVNVIWKSQDKPVKVSGTDLGHSISQKTMLDTPISPVAGIHAFDTRCSSDEGKNQVNCFCLQNPFKYQNEL